MSDTSIVDSAAFVGLAAAVTVAGLGIAYHMATRTQTSALPTVTVPMDSQSLELPVRYTCTQCSPDIQPFVVGWFKDISLLQK